VRKTRNAAADPAEPALEADEIEAEVAAVS
jgi:hypothetical protein